MATSGSIDFIVSTHDIIQEALEVLGVLGEGESPNTAQVTTALRTLNLMTKTWQAQGLNLFAVKEEYLFLIQDQVKYSLTSSTSDNWTSEFTQTTITSDVAQGATSITLASTVGLVVGDFIGIKTDAGEVLHWTTVADAGNPNVIVTDSFPTTASAGSTVYFYHKKANRPMKILEAYTTRVTASEGGVDIPVGIISRVDYGELSNKTAPGVVNQLYQDPQVGNFFINVWPVRDSERNYLKLLVQKTLDEFKCGPDTPDYPQEWYLPLAYGLAVLLAPKYGVPDQVFRRVSGIASGMYSAAEGFDQESQTSVYFKPDTWGRDVARTGG